MMLNNQVLPHLSGSILEEIWKYCFTFWPHLSNIYYTGNNLVTKSWNKRSYNVDLRCTNNNCSKWHFEIVYSVYIIFYLLSTTDTKVYFFCFLLLFFFVLFCFVFLLRIFWDFPIWPYCFPIHSMKKTFNKNKDIFQPTIPVLKFHVTWKTHIHM